MSERSLNDLFHLVKQVLPEGQEVVSVLPETPARAALQTMGKLGLSQLPVVKGQEVLGAFSYRSWAEGVLRLPKQELDPLAIPVEEFIEDLSFAAIDDTISTLLTEFNLRDALLVGTRSQLQGIITTYDALEYFYRVASPYVLLRTIELAIRELIRLSVSEEGFAECVDRALAKHYGNEDGKPPASLEEMNFHDYVGLLRHGDNWPSFQTSFGGSRHTANAKLRHLPKLRNDVFHFRRELTLEEYESLRETRDWLLTRMRIVRADEGVERDD